MKNSNYSLPDPNTDHPPCLPLYQISKSESFQIQQTVIGNLLNNQIQNKDILAQDRYGCREGEAQREKERDREIER